MNMCSQETHITSDMYRETSNPSDMCSPTWPFPLIHDCLKVGLGEHLSLGICVSG